MKARLIHKLLGHTGSVYTLCRKGNDDTFLSGDGNGMIVEWNLRKEGEAKLLAKVNTSVYSIEWIPQKGYLLAGQMQGGIHVLDPEAQKELKHILHHEGGVFDIKLHKEDKLYTTGGNGKLAVWDTDLTLLASISVSGKSIRSIDFHPFKNEMALGCSDNYIYIMDRDEWTILKRIVYHKSSVFSVKYSPDGKYLLSGSRDAHLSAWDTGQHYSQYKAFAAHYFTINDITFSPDGNYVATASRDKTIKIWDARDFSLLCIITAERMEAHLNSVNKLIWTPYNNWLISCSDDRSVMVWEIE